MNAWLRQLAVLSVLWAVCEMLLPEGRQQQMVRMTMGALVMTALLSTAGETAQSMKLFPEMPAFSDVAAQTAEEGYRRTALTALANQAVAYCERVAGRAGYAAEAEVTLRMDGGVEEIRLRIAQEQIPILMPVQLKKTLSETLQVDESRIRLLPAP